MKKRALGGTPWVGDALLTLLVACAHSASPSTGVDPISVSGSVTLVGVEDHGGVKVVLQGDYTNITQSDAAGAYRFEGVPAGRYVVKVSYGDFTREGEVSIAIAGEPGDAIEVQALTLTPAGAVAGNATLGGAMSGNSGIRVSLDGTDMVTTTGDDGEYYLARVPIGEYRVRAEKTGYGGRTRRGIAVKFGEVTRVDDLPITQGIAADFNHSPLFDADEIKRTPYQRAPDSVLDPLPFDLAADQVARWDTVLLDAPARDIDGDRLTYFWSVTAGTLDRTDAPSVRWTVSDKTAAQATITVRVVDERSAAAFLSSNVKIVDAQAMSGVLIPAARAVYSYRPFAGTWRVLQYDFASKTVTRVGELTSLDDPAVNLVGAHYHATPFTGGDRRHMFWRFGEAPQERTPDGDGTGLPAGGRLALAKTNAINIYDPAADTTTQLYNCGAEACGALEASADNAVLSVFRGSGVVTAWMHDFSQTTRLSLPPPVSARLRTDGVSIIYVDVPPGGGRGPPNHILRALVGQVYSGAYDVLIGAYNGRFIGYTEQAYRVVYSPERAFMRDTIGNVSIPIDGDNDKWAQDETYMARDGRMLVRRYPRADWLQDTAQTHYQLLTRDLPQ